MDQLLGTDRNGAQMKLQQFETIIGQQVAQRCKEIDRELEEYRRQELEAEENSVLQDSYHLIQREVAEIESETTKAISKSRVQMKQKLYARREEYCKALFADVREQLTKFAASPDYHTFLLGKVEAIAKAYGQDGFLLTVRPADLALEADIRKAFGYPCELGTAEEVSIGGVIARHPQKGYVVDESLDSILESQKEWFHSHSELIVGL